MNEQRRVIYALRDQVLEGANLAQAREEVAAVLERTIEEYTGRGLRRGLGPRRAARRARRRSTRSSIDPAELGDRARRPVGRSSSWSPRTRSASTTRARPSSARS